MSISDMNIKQCESALRRRRIVVLCGACISIEILLKVYNTFPEGQFILTHSIQDGLSFCRWRLYNGARCLMDSELCAS